MECQDFPSKTFCLTVPRNSVENPFSVSLLSGADEVWIREGEAVTRFSVEIFLSDSAERIRKGTLYTFFTTYGYGKNFASQGYVTISDFLSNFFCLTVPQKFVVEPSVLCFKKFPVLKKLMEKRGGSIMIFRRSLLV